ncbi:sensor histidine kinase [Teredinibacter purpureus]|uniref:sensor histidine kinase n=1 Tax=Teredinibacter purpureus TaxID=2731756 RepID=UPI000695E375|nr:sensor histidine kinase [Teredinibacter purpureus]
MPSPHLSAAQPKMNNPWSWISFMFSGFFFFSFAYAELTLHFVVPSLALYGLFAWNYSALIHSSPKNMLALTLSMIALGFFGSYLNPSSSVFLGYAAFFGCFYSPKPRGFLISSVIIISLLSAAKLFNLWYSYYLFPGLITSIAMSFLGAYLRQEDLHRRREYTSSEEKKQLATVAERERIARDLHDTLGHTLSSIALKAQLAKKLGDNGNMTMALDEVSQVATLASEALSDVRRAISGYKYSGLNEQLARLQSRLESASFSVTLHNPLKHLQARQEAALILMITEAVTNILRHSNGNSASITLSKTSSALGVTISDNGSNQDYCMGNGLTGINERLEAFNGNMTITNHNGFHLTLTLESYNNA